jgi:ATP-dependent RNA helicase RhlE
MTNTPFARLGLIEPLLHALHDRGYDTPTPIQQRAIPILLQGKDLLGIAQTGTGKTAAFALPILQRLHEQPRRAEPKRPRALVLAPTRELSSQIVDAFRAYGKQLALRSEVVYGGVGMTPQIRALARGLEILVATPGRLLDHMQQRHVDLSRVEILVLDEADRMLDMGFVRDVERVIRALPKQRQSLLFSATMPDNVAALARGILHQPQRVEVTPQATTTERVEQSVCFVDKAQKRDLLVQLLQDPEFARTLVFTRTKHGADRVARHLTKAGIDARAIHGDKSQGQRERALADFKSGKSGVLIATDVAARGIDVPEVSHVLNFDLPNVPESYVHRIGRTARAGRDGIAISFCSSDEREFLKDIEKLIRRKIPVMVVDGQSGLSGERSRPPAARPQHPRQHKHHQAQPRSPQRPTVPAPRTDWTEIARTLGVDSEPQPQPSRHAHGGHGPNHRPTQGHGQGQGHGHDKGHGHGHSSGGQHAGRPRRGPRRRRRRD